MRKSIFIVAAITAASALAFVACKNSSSQPEKNSQEPGNAEMIKRGEYLVGTSGCDDCHSPKRMGPQGPELIPELRLSGYRSSVPVMKPDSNVIKQGWTLFGPDFTNAAGAWGMSFAANLTSDATGIGNWKEEQFLTAIRHGKFKGLENNRSLLPPMPWEVYKTMSDEDLKAIFAFLKTTKPVKNVVPAPMQIKDIK